MTAKEEKLLERLRKESPEVRRQLVLDAERLSTEAAAEVVFACLGDDDWRVRKEAALLAAKLAAQHDSTTTRLIEASTNVDNIGLRNAAVEALSRAGRDVFDQVVALFQSSDSEARRTAMEILGASQEPAAIDILIEGLRDPHPNVRACAAEWLGGYKSQRAVDALTGCLSPGNRLLSLVALQSLGKMNAAVPWPLLKPLENDRILGEELILAFGRTGAVEAVPRVMADLEAGEPVACISMETLHDATPEVAAEVEATLGRMSDDAEKRLFDLANEDDGRFKQAATRCLLWRRDPRSVRKLVKLARNSSLYTVLLDGLRAWGSLAVNTLLDLLDEATGNELASAIGLLTRLLDEVSGIGNRASFEQLLESDEPCVRTAAAGAVARFGDQSVVPRLIEMTASDERRIRTAAGNALSEIGRRHPDDVFRALADVELEGAQGVEICRALKMVGGPEAVPKVTVALNDPAPELRRAALGTLATLGGERAIPSIVARLADEDIGVRLAAVEALTVVGEPARDAIVSRLGQAEGPLASALTRALGRVGHPHAGEILGQLCTRSADIAVAAIEAAQSLNIHLEAWQDDIFGHADAEVVKRGLEAFGHNVSREYLIRLLAHDEWDVRLAVTKLLEQVTPTPEIVAALSERLSIETDELVRDALSSLLIAHRNRGTK